MSERYFDVIRNERPVIANSLWTATANRSTKFPSLKGEHRADVAVIGGGFTGLSAALHLAEGGATVVVIDAQHPGWGASGRNGGQINVGLKDSPSVIKKKFGEYWGERMISMAGDAGDLVFDLIQMHCIECEAKRPGWLRAAHTPNTLRQLHVLAEDWSRHGGGMEPLNKEDMQSLTGTDVYLGGVIDHRGGVLHPLNYALGLAEAGAQFGAQIYGETSAEKVERNGSDYRVTTPNGTIVASKVLICTNGYSGDLHKTLAQSVLPICSVQVATSPLPKDVRSTILPKNNALSDARRLLFYFRMDAQGRFLMGGRGTYSDKSTYRQIDRLKRVSVDIFPQLAGIDWKYAWGGYVALTRDHYPHLHELSPGLMSGLGYNCRGVAIATAMGRELALWAAGATPNELNFPVSPVTPLPFSFARNLLVETEILRLRLLDKLGL